MSVSIKEVENVAALARLSFTDDEKQRLMTVMNSILDYFDKLSELDTTDVEPLTHILPIQNVMRDDVVRESFDQETALANAPKSARGHFVIPRVIE